MKKKNSFILNDLKVNERLKFSLRKFVRNEQTGG